MNQTTVTLELEKVTLEHFPWNENEPALRVYHCSNAEMYMSSIDYVYCLFPWRVFETKLSLDARTSWLTQRMLVHVRPEHMTDVRLPEDFSGRDLHGDLRVLPLDVDLLKRGVMAHCSKQEKLDHESWYMTKVHSQGKPQPYLEWKRFASVCKLIEQIKGTYASKPEQDVRGDVIRKLIKMIEDLKKDKEIIKKYEPRRIDKEIEDKLAQLEGELAFLHSGSCEAGRLTR